MTKLVILILAFYPLSMSAQDSSKMILASDTIYYRQLPNGLNAEYRYSKKIMQSKSFYFKQNLVSSYRVDIKSATEIAILPWYFNDSIFKIYKSYSDTANKTSLKKYPEEEPQFIGGDNDFQGFLENVINYPEAAKVKNRQGVAKVEYTISKEGVISSIKCQSSIDPLLIKEALRAINLTDGCWLPKTMNCRIAIPITFELD